MHPEDSFLNYSDENYGEVLFIIVHFQRGVIPIYKKPKVDKKNIICTFFGKTIVLLEKIKEIEQEQVSGKDVVCMLSCETTSKKKRVHLLILVVCPYH